MHMTLFQMVAPVFIAYDNWAEVLIPPVRTCNVALIMVIYWGLIGS